MLCIYALFVTAILVFSETLLLCKLGYALDGSSNSITEEIETQIQKGKRCILIYDYSELQMMNAITMINDNPDMFYIKNEYSTTTFDRLTILKLKDSFGNKEEAVNKIDRMSSAILDTVTTDEMNDFEKSFAIHDWLCNNVSYGYTIDGNDQNAYGAISNKIAACSGYSEAFALLMNKAGIECYVISGRAGDGTDETASHAWNAAHIDGDYYYYDVTWDDIGDDISPSHKWCCVSGEVFALSHIKDDTYKYYTTKNNKNYFRIKEKFIERYSIEAIAEQIEKQGNDVEITFANEREYVLFRAAVYEGVDMVEILRLSGIESLKSISYEYEPDLNYVRILIVA